LAAYGQYTIELFYDGVWLTVRFHKVLGDRIDAPDRYNLSETDKSNTEKEKQRMKGVPGYYPCNYFEKFYQFSVFVLK